MDASLIPYRKVTAKAVQFLNNEINLSELHEETIKSLKALEIHGTTNENYKLVKEWQVRTSDCMKDTSKIDNFKKWMNEQHVFATRNS